MNQLKKKVEELYQISIESDAKNLTLGCFLDNKCNINLCRNKKDNKYCPFYENKCRLILESVFRDVYGEENKVA